MAKKVTRISEAASRAEEGGSARCVTSPWPLSYSDSGRTGSRETGQEAKSKGKANASESPTLNSKKRFTDATQAAAQIGTTQRRREERPAENEPRTRMHPGHQAAKSPAPKPYLRSGQITSTLLAGLLSIYQRLMGCFSPDAAPLELRGTERYPRPKRMQPRLITK